VAEYELNHSILNAADSCDRTVIFISHRLSTTRFADRIFLFANGELSEQGSHDELIALNGKYAEMFGMQAENYRRKAEEDFTHDNPDYQQRAVAFLSERLISCYIINHMNAISVKSIKQRLGYYD
jgi:ABC-type glutathione transport system ATPase component